MPRTLAVLLRAALLAVAAAALGAGVPAGAGATTTFSTFQGVITISGDDAPSRIVAVGGADQALFEDFEPGGVVVAQAPCVLLTPARVDCGKADAGSRIVATLGGGDDIYEFLGNPVQVIDTGDGNDRIITGTAKDTLTGGPGDDDLSGSFGDDTLDGGAGDDWLDGGAGGDQLTGGAGRDTLLGDGNAVDATNRNDIINARDGERDTIDCGGGYDLAHVDTIDDARACSNLDKPGSGGNTVPSPDLVTGTPGAGSGGASTLQGPLTFRIALTKRQTPRGLAAGKKLRASITPSATCTGTVRIALAKAEAVRLRLGTTPLDIGTSATTTFSAGTATTATVAVSGEFRAKLRAVARIKGALTVQCVDATGATTIGTNAITLRR